MKRIVLITALLSSCTLVAEERPWAFVEAVGGIAVEAPQRTAKGIILPVRADVSGLVAITVRPTTMNSALACSATRAKVFGLEIRLRISTALARGGDSSRCRPAALGNLAPGKYNVFYGQSSNEMKPLGEVTLAP